MSPQPVAGALGGRRGPGRGTVGQMAPSGNRAEQPPTG
jgi:hypothetical protein